MDFKIVTALDAGKYGDWEAAGHAPEADFLAKLAVLAATREAALGAAASPEALAAFDDIALSRRQLDRFLAATQDAQ